MCSWPDRRGVVRRGLAACAGVLVLHAQAQTAAAAYPNIGRAATVPELAAWDIDVRPDFRGLPPGSGSVRIGLAVWESKCASCHGIFGESNQVFAPIVGGTTPEDIRNGRVASLADGSHPGRTTLMKLSSVATLWDYINRAMPWTQPKSLGIEEVYGVTAYILNMGGIVPDDFTLSDRNIAQVQQRLPNRNGVTTDHGLWPGAAFGRGRPDVRAAACMKNCTPAPSVASFVPDYARDAHGNLAQQNRAFGAQVGVDTRRTTTEVAAQLPAAGERGGATAIALAQRHGCTACHGVDAAVIGPSFGDIAGKYAGRSDAAAYLSTKITDGSVGVWGPLAMPPQRLAPPDAMTIAHWLSDGAKR